MSLYNTMYVYRKRPDHTIAKKDDLVVTMGQTLLGHSCKQIEFMVPITVGDLNWIQKELFSRLVPEECPKEFKEITA